MPSAAPGFNPKSSGRPERGTMREGIVTALLVCIFVLVNVIEGAPVLSFVSLSQVSILSFSRSREPGYYRWLLNHVGTDADYGI